jgi:hypothetical protein
MTEAVSVGIFHARFLEHRPERPLRDSYDRPVLWFDAERHYEVEPCQLAMENGAHRALIPIENRRQFLEVSGDVAERLDPIFYGDAPVAANKALAIT